MSLSERIRAGLNSAASAINRPTSTVTPSAPTVSRPAASTTYSNPSSPGGFTWASDQQLGYPSIMNMNADQVAAQSARHDAALKDNQWWNLFSNTSGSGGGGGGSLSGGSAAPGDAPVATDPTQNERLQEAANYFQSLPGWSYYTPMDQAAMDEQAQGFAELYATPALKELEYKLEQSIADAAAQEERIRGAFGGMEDTLGRREAEQRRIDLESAIARGAGRSGVVDHLSGQRQEHFSELLAAEEAKKSAEMANIANQLAMIQRQVPEMRMDVQDQASRIASQELARLRELEYTRGREHDMDQWDRAMNVFDRTMLTPVEQLQLYMMLADTAGNFPGQVPSIYGT